MNGILRRFSTREWVLVGLTLMVGIIMPLYALLLLPQWRRLDQVRTEASLLETELIELQSNLSIREQVDVLYQQANIEPLPADKSEHIITSDLLRKIDTIRANYPSLSVTNIRPLLPPEASRAGKSSNNSRNVTETTSRGGDAPGGGGRIYLVRMTVSGKLPEIVDFVTSLTHQRVLIRLDSYTLRGVQGVNLVECKMQLGRIGFPGHTGETDVPELPRVVNAP